MHLTLAQAQVCLLCLMRLHVNVIALNQPCCLLSCLSCRLITSTLSPCFFSLFLQLALEAGDGQKGAQLLAKATALSQGAGKDSGLGAHGGVPALLATRVALHQQVSV